jgi:hypothetical protein
MQWNAEKADLMDKGGSSSTSVEDPFFPAFSDLIRVPCFLSFQACSLFVKTQIVRDQYSQI